MSHNDPHNPRPQGPPDFNPLGHTDRAGNWNGAILVAVIVAALVVVSIVVWANIGGHLTTNNPPATTGQGGQPPPRIAR
jgi:hypothetical protein